MAERLKSKLLETDKMLDLVAGPGMVIIGKPITIFTSRHEK